MHTYHGPICKPVISHVSMVHFSNYPQLLRTDGNSIGPTKRWWTYANQASKSTSCSRGTSLSLGGVLDSPFLIAGHASSKPSRPSPSIETHKCSHRRSIRPAFFTRSEVHKEMTQATRSESLRQVNSRAATRRPRPLRPLSQSAGDAAGSWLDPVVRGGVWSLVHQASKLVRRPADLGDGDMLKLERRSTQYARRRVGSTATLRRVESLDSLPSPATSGRMRANTRLNRRRGSLRQTIVSENAMCLDMPVRDFLQSMQRHNLIPVGLSRC